MKGFKLYFNGVFIILNVFLLSFFYFDFKRLFKFNLANVLFIILYILFIGLYFFCTFILYYNYIILQRIIYYIIYVGIDIDLLIIRPHFIFLELFL